MKTNSSTLANSRAHLRGSLPRPSPTNRTLRRCLTAGVTLGLLFCAALAQAITFNDGLTHTVNDATYQDEGIAVANGTTLIIEAGAVLGGAAYGSGWVEVLDTSSVTINGGTFGGAGINSGFVNANNGTATVTINGGTFGGAGVGSGAVRSLDYGTMTVVTINGGTFGGAGAGSGAVFAFANSTVKFRASNFDTTSYDSTSGGTLGVTFCGQTSQNITVLNYGGTVTLETISCPRLNVFAKVGPPTAAEGPDGFFAIDGLNGDLYGPKTEGVWPAPLSLKGDKGDQGIQGIQGLKGDKGDQGMRGIQGLKGDKGGKGDTGPGLVKGAVIFLAPGSTPPAGFAKVGTTSQSIVNQSGKVITSKFDVWQMQ